jgi:hypothetical protein
MEPEKWYLLRELVPLMPERIRTPSQWGCVIARVVDYGLVDCIESAASLTRVSLRLSDGHSLLSHERVLLDVFEWRMGPPHC